MPLLRRILIAGVTTSVLVLATLGVLWKTGRLAGWARAWVVDHALRKYAPRLPFQIESVDVQETWAEFRAGRIKSVSAVVHWAPWRIRLVGPVQFSRDAATDRAEVSYQPVMTIEPDTDSKASSSPLRWSLRAAGSKNFSHFTDIDLDLSQERLEWRSLGLEWAKPLLKLGWHEGQVRARVGGKTLTWAPENRPGRVDRGGSLSDFEFSATGKLALHPTLAIDPVSFQAHARGMEWMQGDSYISIPLHSLGVSGQLGVEIKKSELTDALLTWRTKHGSVREIAMSLLKNAREPWSAIKITQGKVGARGQVRFKRGEDPDVQAQLDLEGLYARWDDQNAAIHDLSIHLPLTLARGVEGASIAFDSAYFKKIRAHLEPLAFSITGSAPFLGGRAPLNWRVEQPQLSIDEIPLTLAPVQGTLDLRTGKLHATTRLKITQMDIQKLSPGLCAFPGRIPPVTISVDLPRITLTESSVVPEGSIRAELFGGTIDLTQLSARELNSALPELGFDLAARGIRLDRMSQWTGFGEIDGTLTVTSRNTLVRGSTPVRYDALLRVTPLENRSEAVFSTQAMFNFVRLLGGPAVDNLPWYVNFAAFGPAASLFGGYNVYYAGILAHSSNGAIVLKTLDDDQVGAQMHFILRGRRVNIPLHAPRYPVVVDASAWLGFIKRVGGVLTSLRRDKTSHAQELFDETFPDCDPPNH